MVLTERPRRPARAWVEAWPGWKHFDHLLVLLKVDYSAMARDAFDGLDARRCVLGAGGGCELWHDDWRFKTLVAPTRSAEALIRRIGQDLERAVQSTSC